MRSMYTAVSGLKNHQTFMDVIANNIANVNTTAFKQQRVSFQDILSQTVQSASSAQNGKAGTNAQQVGLGVQLAGINTIQTQGTLQSTGKLTDMAISGDGYFDVSDGKQNLYTRDGSFDLGTDNTLVSPANGLHVQGWQANPATGLVNNTGPLTNITIPLGAGMTGRASTTLSVTGNLDSTIPVVTVPPTPSPSVSATLYDSLGNAVPATLTGVIGTPTATGTPWVITAATAAVPARAAVAAVAATVGPPPTAAIPAIPAFAGVTASSTNFTVTFDTAGKFVSSTPAPANILLLAANSVPGAAPDTISVDFTQMTQLASPSNMITSTDGASAGTLSTFSIGQDGTITGIYTNGYKQPLGQLAMASFANPAGLTNQGGNLETISANSGAAVIGVAGTNGLGTISTGFLEGSNVDLAQQFSDMIMAERGYQANSKVITTSDEILQDLIGMKR